MMVGCLRLCHLRRSWFPPLHLAVVDCLSPRHSRAPLIFASDRKSPDNIDFRLSGTLASLVLLEGLVIAWMVARHSTWVLEFVTLYCHTKVYTTGGVVIIPVDWR